MLRWSLIFVLALALLLAPIAAAMQLDLRSQTSTHCCCSGASEQGAVQCPHCAALQPAADECSPDAPATSGGCCDPSGLPCTLCPCCAAPAVVGVDTASQVERPADQVCDSLTLRDVWPAARTDEPRSPVPRLS